MENILVIGGGLMGSAAAWKLAARGASVKMLEQQAEHYDRGSSYGTARISRSLGPKKDVFSHVHNQTVKEIAKLISYLNDEGTSEEHSMDDIYSTSPVSYLFHKDDYAEIKKFRFKKQRKDFSKASQHSSFRKFGISIPKDTILVRERRKYSGTLNPQELLRKLHLGIRKKGGQIMYQHQIQRLVKEGDIFEVTVLDLATQKTQVIQAKKVIVAAGAYTVGVLQEYAPYFKRLITPKKVVLSYLKIADERYAQLLEVEKKALRESLPLFSQIGKEFYAMITRDGDGASPIIKAGGHQRRRNIHDLRTVWYDDPQRKELKWIKKQFRKHLKMLEIHVSKKDIEEVDNYTCVYAETRTKRPIVSQIFNQYGVLDPHAVVCGGMSGIGAKGCLAYGALAADLILGTVQKPNKMYRKMTKAFGNPSVNLYTKRPKPGRLF